MSFSGTGPINKPTVLLVDETPFFLGIEKQFLRYSSVVVITMDDYAEALAYCRATPPSLVYIDRGAPEMSGVECCRAIKQKTSCKIPVVMICADSPAERKHCQESGCDAILTKPLERKLFLETGRKLLPAIDRREQRVLCYMTVFYRAKGKSSYGKSMDLSAGGLFLETSASLLRDDEVRVSFSLPDAEDSVIELPARVAWQNSPSCPSRSSYPTGVGLEFIEPSPQIQARLRSYVACVAKDLDSSAATLAI